MAALPPRAHPQPRTHKLELLLFTGLIALAVLDRLPVSAPLLPELPGFDFQLSAYRLASLPLLAAILFLLLYRRRLPWTGTEPTALCMWGLLAAMAASALSAPSPSLSLLHLLRFVEYALISQLLAAVLLVAWRPNRWRWLAWGVTLSAVGASLTILTDFFGLSHFYLLYESQRPYVRHMGLLGEANYAAAKLVILLPFLLQLGLRAFREGRSREGYAAILSTLIVLFALFITGSRMGGLLVLILALLYGLQGFRWLLRPKVLLSATVAALIVLGAAWALNERALSQAFRYISQRYALLATFLTTGQEAFGPVRETSLKERLAVLQGGIQMFADHPLLGVGLAHFPLRIGEYQARYGGYYSHNTYLTVLAELGLLGSFFFTALLIRVFVLLRRAAVLHPERYSYSALQNSYVLLLVAFFFLHDLENQYLWALFLPFALYLERWGLTPSTQGPGGADEPAPPPPA